MKKTLLVFCLALGAIAAEAQMHGTGTLVIGSTQGATNLVNTAGFGDWTLWGTDTATLGAYFGQSAGAYGHGLYRCTALGFAAMAKATNCTDCIAIGPRVGQNWRNRTGWVQIGNAFVYTNGIAVVKAERGAKIGPLQLNVNHAPGDATFDNELSGNLSLKGRDTAYGLDGGNLYAQGDVWGQTGNFQEIKAATLILEGNGSHVEISADAQGRLAVVVNGETAGYLTITPPAAQQ